MLKAYKKLKDRQTDAELFIAGDGPDRKKLEDWVILHDAKDVHFLGYITEEQKHRLLEEADLFCSPAIYGESFGIVLLEAMAMGVPTVAGNNPGYKAVLKDQPRSVVDPKDTPEFAKRLSLFLTDDNLREDWKTWAKNNVRQYDYPKVIDKYEELYQEVLEA